jgi:hypothetical protein
MSLVSKFRQLAPVRVLLSGGAILLTTFTSFAYVAPTPVANVTYIEMSYVPDAVYFQVDQPVANCIAGAYLIWQGGATFPKGASDESMRRSSVRNMAQVLLHQKTVGAKITVYANTAPSGNQYCVVENIHLPQ